MKLNIHKITYNEAKSICSWVYEDPYYIYSMDDSEECINELLDGNCYSVANEDNELLGYYCFGESAMVPIGHRFNVYDDKNFIDIGLGMRPDLCGQGFGAEFFGKCLDFAKDNFSDKKFRLTVASFNARAIKLYANLGFEKDDFFVRENDNTIFYIMKK